MTPFSSQNSTLHDLFTISVYGLCAELSTILQKMKGTLCIPSKYRAVDKGPKIAYKIVNLRRRGGVASRPQSERRRLVQAFLVPAVKVAPEQPCRRNSKRAGNSRYRVTSVTPCGVEFRWYRGFLIALKRVRFGAFFIWGGRSHGRIGMLSRCPAADPAGL